LERWKTIPEFPNYEVSSYGNVRNIVSNRLMALNMNQYGVVFVGVFHQGEQHKKSVPLLVANAFIPRKYPAYDTPINVDGDRWNNSITNLMWRPRWFAVKYNRQFRVPYEHHIPFPIEDIKTGEISIDSFECARLYGLLEKDVVLSISNNTYAWPTYQRFRVVEK
jgi:hypothetical protein